MIMVMLKAIKKTLMMMLNRGDSTEYDVVLLFIIFTVGGSGNRCSYGS